MGPSVLESAHACHLRYDLVFQGDLPAPFRACSRGATISETTKSGPQQKLTQNNIECELYRQRKTCLLSSTGCTAVLRVGSPGLCLQFSVSEVTMTKAVA